MAEEFSLSELARAVWRRKRLAALTIVTCVAAAGIITHFLPKIYRAETSVFFPESRATAASAALGVIGQSPGLLSALGGLSPTSDAAALCKAIAESYSVRAEICRRFGLQQRLRAEGLQDAAEKLRDATWVNITPEGLLAIRVDTTDPQLSADIANAYDGAVERRYRESSVTRARQERQFLERRTTEAQEGLGGAEAELKAYQEGRDAVLVPEQVPPILQKLTDVRVEQARAEVELGAMRRSGADAITQLDRLAAAEVSRAGHGDDSRPPKRRPVYVVPWERSSETTSDNPDIAELRAELVGLEAKLAAARHDLLPEHPDVKRLQSEVEETRARLAQEARKTITSETRTRSPVYAAALEDMVKLETEVIGQQARVEGLAQLVRQIEGRAAALPQRLLEYARLERQVRTREAVCSTFISQLEAAKLKELQEQPVFEVLDVAVPPQRHERPKLVINLAVALIFGALLGVAITAALGPPTRS